MYQILDHIIVLCSNQLPFSRGGFWDVNHDNYTLYLFINVTWIPVQNQLWHNRFAIPDLHYKSKDYQRRFWLYFIVLSAKLLGWATASFSWCCAWWQGRWRTEWYIVYITKLECGTWYHHPRRLQCVWSRNLRIFKVAKWHYRCRHNLRNNCIWDNLQCCLLVPRSPSKPVILTFDLQSRKV